MTQIHRRRTVLRTLGAAGSVSIGMALAGCSSNGTDDTTPTATPGGDGEATTVEMTDNLVFDPESITIAVGDTVVWENVGSIGHSVTAYEDEIPEEAEYFASGGFDSEEAARSEYAAGDAASGDIAGGESYRHTFEVAGTYEYFCIPHEMSGMVGTVTAEA